MEKKVLGSLFVLLVIIVFTGCQLDTPKEIEIATLEESTDTYCLNPEVEAQFFANQSKATTGPYLRMYEHTNYAGGYYFAYSSDGNISNFKNIGINDKVSSIRVYNGARAKLWQNANYGGVYMYIFENVSNLKDYGYNDMFSSLSWYTSSYYAQFAILYEHASYKGRNVVVFSALSNLSSYGLNDKTSSLRMIGLSGKTVRLYEHASYKGFYKDFTGNYSNLKNASMNDRVSSVRVYR